MFFDSDDHIFEVTPKRAINEASFLIRVRDNRKLDYELIQQMNYTLIAREVVKNGKYRYVCSVTLYFSRYSSVVLRSKFFCKIFPVLYRFGFLFATATTTFRNSMNNTTNSEYSRIVALALFSAKFMPLIKILKISALMEFVTLTSVAVYPICEYSR